MVFSSNGTKEDNMNNEEFFFLFQLTQIGVPNMCLSTETHLSLLISVITVAVPIDQICPLPNTSHISAGYVI